MKLLLSWVRDFVDIKVPAAQLAETLALRGFEVASIETIGNDDAVIDFEVTANRPDCLSVLGFAREIATTYSVPLRPPSMAPGSRVSLAPTPTGTTDRLTVRIEDEALCPRYTAAVAEVTQTTSPAWMTARLQAAGVRAISPFVDITNYVLLELGHPLHAFDLDTLAERTLRIRRATPGEKLTTLDGIERSLDPDMLLIADAVRGQAVAGVMGGGLSEVSARTKVVAFESAYFAPASVRRTSKRLGLKTEASARFERGADINGTATALQRALALMHEIGAGQVVSPLIDHYPHQRGPLTIRLRRRVLDRLLGLSVPDADVVRILRALGLVAETTADAGWDVIVPTFRVDLVREVDLIEEVGRHWGFDKLDAAFPVMTSAAATPDRELTRDRVARRVLTGAGVSEAVTFGFIETKAAEPFVAGEPSATLVPIANPLSAKFDVLRPSLLPGLLDAVARNRRHGRRDVALFEIGARFSLSGGETRGVAVALTGAHGEHWSGGGREVDFYDAKGLIELLGDALGVDVQLETDNALPGLVPGQSARVVHGAETIGVIGTVQPALVDRAGAPKQDRVVAAELNLDRITALQQPRSEAIQPLPRHPFVVRDLSIVVPDALPAAVIRDTIQTAGRNDAAPLTAITFFDRYQGKGVPDGSISVSVRLTFQAADRTLTDADVQHAFEQILSALVREHGAVQR